MTVGPRTELLIDLFGGVQVSSSAKLDHELRGDGGGARQRGQRCFEAPDGPRMIPLRNGQRRLAEGGEHDVLGVRRERHREIGPGVVKLELGLG